MPDSTKQGVKGRVSSGPASQTKGTVYNGPPPATQGTVYNGPSMPATGGTVYNGPPVQGTIYGGPPRATSRSRTVTPDDFRKLARLFYAIAGLSLFNTVMLFLGSRRAMSVGLGITRLDILIKNGVPMSTALWLNVIGAGFFALLGVFASSGNKLVFLIGMLAYAGDTLVLIADGFALHPFSIIFHGFIVLLLAAVWHRLPD